MKNRINNALLDEYQKQVEEIMDSEELIQQNTYIFYHAYEVGGLSDLGECCCESGPKLLLCCAGVSCVFCLSSCCCGTNNYFGEFQLCNFQESCCGLGCSYCQHECSLLGDSCNEGCMLCKSGECC